CWDSPAQKFLSVATAPVQVNPTPAPTPPTTAGAFNLRAMHSNLCLRSESGGTRAGANTAQGTCDSSALAFTESTMSDGSKQFRVNGTSVCLSVLNNSTEKAAKIGLSNCAD